MRTENEMYSLILEVAKNDDRIKAVYMNGSRTNENVPKDMFQDYDIVYVVEDTESSIEDKDWVRVFGCSERFFICSIPMKIRTIQAIRKILMAI